MCGKEFECLYASLFDICFAYTCYQITEWLIGRFGRVSEHYYNVLIERIQDTTTNIQKTRNTITIRDGEEKNSYISEPVADKDLENNAFKDTKNNLSLSTTVVNDKLLNGLLSSSFEEASCISRFQSYLYQKISPYKPSKYLISKLRNYEHLHQSCGPYTKSYNEIIKEGAKVSENGVDSKCKYFIWTVEDGLGNRMISMVSAFLYAILTDRVLLVRFGDDMLNLFCEPFPNSSWLLPKNSPYWNNLKQFETHKIIFIDNKENNSRELLQPALVINLRHTHAGPTNRFHCDKNQHHLQKIPVLILQSNEYFVPTLYMVSSFREDFNKMFPDKDTIFHHLGRYLFQPSNVAWERIRNLYEEHLAKENERIGLQIRVFNTRQAPPQTVIDEIISCIHQNKLLPKFNMHNLTTLSLKNNTSKVVLVVSLYSKYGEGLKRLYQNNTTLSREVIKVYQPSHEEHQNSRTLPEEIALTGCLNLPEQPSTHSAEANNGGQICYSDFNSMQTIQKGGIQQCSSHGGPVNFELPPLPGEVEAPPTSLSNRAVIVERENQSHQMASLYKGATPDAKGSCNTLRKER
ncbi:Galactoside 2-alpha-L-fucosyltransferase [Vigna angularis]|uniref:Fucosyltransferase n=1 Tax=Phaseolus angularis TaxID=3914 RepID=A0A8T0JCL6_PHAAN|nr:Galactoside 2-alpha-L-fucosyltransferase [Vigna angularis]